MKIFSESTDEDRCVFTMTVLENTYYNKDRVKT